MALDIKQIILRLALATAIGLLFGLDRERARKPAGMRTFTLICLASCLVAIVSAYGYTAVSQVYPANVNVNTDPARLMVGVLTGIGFIGAGIIWRSPRGDVSGVTTAAAIFMVATLGICCGLGLYVLVAFVAPLALLIMISERLLGRDEEQYEEKLREKLKREITEAMEKAEAEKTAEKSTVEEKIPE